MSTWRQRVGALFGGRNTSFAAAGVLSHVTSPSTLPPVEAVVADGQPAAGEASVAIDLRQPFFEWVTGSVSEPSDTLQDGERLLLAHLDAVLGSADKRAALLPRAPAVIPQLLNSLRDEAQSATALAQRVLRDPHLVAEVIRLANSAHARADEPVVDIAEAIGRLGTSGLRRAIARVVLKPMFGGAADTLSARCAERLWQHSDAQAAACQQEASARGLDPFEGYLTGLMHNVGWTAALRAIDRSTGGAPTRFSRAFVGAFEQRRESFFAMLVIPWQLTDGLTALGTALADGDLAGTCSPLGEALRAAERRASLEMLGAGAAPLH
jgi:hypothetical protein